MNITFYDTVLGLQNDCDLTIAGSNSYMLSSDIGTNFRGRGNEVRVHPLSFREFASAYEGTQEQTLREYLRFGGMPQVLQYQKDAEREAYLKRLLEDILETELIGRHAIRNRSALKEVLALLASSAGVLLNPTSIAERIPAARNTVADDLRYLEEAFLIEGVNQIDVRRKDDIQDR